MSFCCDEFATLASPLAGAYADARMAAAAQFEQSDDGAWNINGCCGGGCYVVTDMRFCPYCGTKLDAGATS